MDNVATSIIENERKMSENNATIAENQQKIYEAGVRAGLAQDPDYAEGYRDGLDSATGVEWESLLDGTTPVGKAREADHAANADRSVKADHATNADHSISTDHSTEADHATNADHSIEADHATNADHSIKADYATNSGHATTATAASNADYATNSSHADIASNADHASSAGAIDSIDALTKLGVSLIATGSYVGTRTYGSSNPNSLTFPFVPKVVFIMGEHTGDQMMLINGTACGMSHYCLSKDYSNKSIGTNVVTWVGNTVRWYCNTTDVDMTSRYINGQLNGSYSLTHSEVNYSLTKTDASEWRQDETGAYPCDFLVVKLKEPLPDNVETYCVIYDTGDSEGSSSYEVYFDNNGEVRIYFGGSSDNSGYVDYLRVEGGTTSYVDYTVYEATAYSINSRAETYHYIAIG